MDERLTDEQLTDLITLNDSPGPATISQPDLRALAEELLVLRAKFEFCDELRIEYRDKLAALSRSTPARAVYPDDAIKGGAQ